jgi:hypothetical protein
MQQEKTFTLQEMENELDVSLGEDGKYYGEASTLFGNMFGSPSHWPVAFTVVVNGKAESVIRGTPEYDGENELKWVNYSTINDSIKFAVFND